MRPRPSDGGRTDSARMPKSAGPLLRRKFRPSNAAMDPLRTALDRGLLSIRGVDRTLRVAWSLADLAGRDLARAGRGSRRAELPAGREPSDERAGPRRVQAVPVPGGRTALRGNSPPWCGARAGGGRRPDAARVRSTTTWRSTPSPGATIDCAADDLELLARRGGRLITPDDDEWPLLAFAAFDHAAPRTRRGAAAGRRWCLWAQGPARLDETAQRAAAVVGTRAATAYGEHVAADLAAGLAEREVAVVSGGAYGIDGAAHRAALAATGPRSRCWPAGSTCPTRPVIRRCCTASASTGCCSPNTRPA